MRVLRVRKKDVGTEHIIRIPLKSILWYAPREHGAVIGLTKQGVEPLEVIESVEYIDSIVEGNPNDIHNKRR